MTIFIEGVAFPLGVINANGWGVPFAEADNAIKSLKTSVVRICSRVDPHGCDYFGDPNSELGHVVDAWQDGDDIMCRAEITDSVASQKIEDGTWKQNWSIFTGFSDVDSGGWGHGIVIESITLVNDPAWETAKWNVVSASKEGKRKVHTISPYKIVTYASLTSQTSQPKGDETIPDEPTVEDLKNQLETANKLIEELKPKVELIPGLESQVTELTASKTKLEKDLSDKTKLVASLELEKGKSIPLAELDTRIAAAIEKHDKEKDAELKLSAARTKFVAARKEALNLDTTADEFTSLSAADFEKLASELSQKLEAGWDSGPAPIYPGGGGGGKIKSPIYDPTTKTYTGV